MERDLDFAYERYEKALAMPASTYEEKITRSLIKLHWAGEIKAILLRSRQDRYCTLYAN